MSFWFLDLFMLWRFCPYVGIWILYFMDVYMSWWHGYLRCMLYFRCDILLLKFLCMSTDDYLKTWRLFLEYLLYSRILSLWGVCYISVDVGEALDLFNTLQWLLDMQFDSVNFVVDSKVTTDAFNSNRHDVTEFCHIITTCQNIFYSYFTNSKVEFNQLQANVAALVLVDETTLLATSTIYFDVPDCINIFIINKMF